MDPGNVKTIVDCASPTSVTNVQVFIAITNFYRRFIRDFSKIIMLIVNLTRKEAVFRLVEYVLVGYSSTVLVEYRPSCTRRVLGEY
jgi:hypothetical protein